MNKNYGLFGAAVQTAKGTAATKPTVSFRASDDSDGISADVSTDPLKLTIGGRTTTVAQYISKVEAKAGVTTIGFADVLGLMLYAAMGADTVTGTASPYIHDIKAGESLPYLTFFQQVGSSAAALQTLQDAKVDEVKISAEGVKPLAFDYTLMGTAPEWSSANTWTGTESKVSDGYFTLADAVVLFSLNSDTPAAVEAGVNLSKLEVDVSNGIEGVTALGTASYRDVQEKSGDVKVTIEGTSDSTVLYRRVITGSDTGTKIASAIVNGSLQMTFKHSVNAAWSFVIKVPTIPWKCDVMGVSTEGGPFSLKLSTDGAVDNGNGAAEFLVSNAVAKYTV